jgi:hypothetical protein
MAKYDRQLIIALLTGDEHDASTAAQARALNEKERAEELDSEIVTVRYDASTAGTFSASGVEELRQALAGRLAVSRPVTAGSRVYLVGSGRWRQRRLAAWLPEEVAELFGQVNMPDVKVISIVADELGRGSSAMEQQGQPECMDSFAAVFQRRLKEVCQIRPAVHARVMKVAVVLPGTDGRPAAGAPAPGRKVTALEGETLADALSRGHHRPRSKVKFYWEGDEQRAEWAY